MTWAELIPISTGVIYLAGAAVYAYRYEWWPALMYAAYAVANVGIVGLTVRGR